MLHMVNEAHSSQAVFVALYWRWLYITTTLLYTIFTVGYWHSKRSHAIRSWASNAGSSGYIIVTLIIYYHLVQSIELLSTNMSALLWLNGETLERTPTPLLANLEGSPPIGILFTSHDYNTSYSLASHTLWKEEGSGHAANHQVVAEEHNYRAYSSQGGGGMNVVGHIDEWIESASYTALYTLCKCTVM